MAMAVVYTNFGGRLVHESRNGIERHYLSDPLGSLVGEINENGSLTYEAEYWPFGETRTESGTKRSEWGFVGLLGYLEDASSMLYVRMRHYLAEKARWLTVDSLWSQESPYKYARNSPIVFVDPSGNQECLFCTPGEPVRSQACGPCASALLKKWWSEPAHNSDHKYTHCMACCTLTKLAGPGCATENQFLQNLIDVYPAKGRVKRIGARFDACFAGRDAGLSPTKPPRSHHGHCHEACSKQFGLTKGTPPLSYVPECDPINWKCIPLPGSDWMGDVVYTKPSR